ncbi:hypothetical protein BKA64DRAFT_574373 [Cadophora sp. MPI-SDFR-AT-0126]|nr:hypothetical protein BKA64DRAFT_574373 [Leotiomycetes sp. MPI-SDFR-AT-0126]
MRRNRHPRERPNLGAGVTEKRPVSCAFCRSRKLRCTREFPCSNCVERGISCQLRPPSQVSTSSSPAHTCQTTSEVSNLEIVQRVERLEEIIRSQGSVHDVTDRILPSPTPSRAESHPLAADIARLEKVSMGESFSDSLSPDVIVFMICPIQQIPNMPKYVSSGMGQDSANSFTRCVWLPQYEETKVPLDKYISGVAYFHHVIHIPSLWNVMNELYTNVEQHRHPDPSQVALLSSIIASTTYSWTAIDCNESIFPTTSEANRQIPFWIKTTEDVLDYCYRNTCPSLEIVQSTIISSFLVCNLEGLAQRFRFLHSSAVMMARELNLHRTDEPSISETLEPVRTDTVKAEIGRRVWWYLVATDWMLSRFPGPMKDVYSIDPSQMAVSKPRNANDEDLFDGMRTPEKTKSTPTTMSHFLERIRLAELCRNFTDRTPFLDLSDDAKRYTDAMSNDAKLQAFVEQIPTLFRLDREGGSDFVDPDINKAPSITIQRYMLNSLIQTQRCKLHLPWLSSGSNQPSYLYSYRCCLDSARLIVENELQLEKAALPFVLMRLKFSPMLYGVAMAGLVLSLEKSLRSTTDRQNTQEAYSDSWNPFRILGEAREQCSTAAMLLDSMEKVLRKHKIPTPDMTPSAAKTFEKEQTAFAETQESDPLWSVGDVSTGSGVFAGFEGSFQTLEPNIDFDTLDWTSLPPDSAPRSLEQFDQSTRPIASRCVHKTTNG